VTVFSALSLAGVLFLVALAVGVAIGARLAPRGRERRQRVAVEAAGITVAQMLERIVALMPLGTAVVDRHRDVVYHNSRAKELGLVREGFLADLLLVDGDPLANIAILRDAKRILAVMKDGVFAKAPPLREGYDGRAPALATTADRAWSRAA